MVIISGKPDTFIAGADIHMIAGCTEAAQAQALSESGQRLFNLIENYPLPVVAAIHGSCLGGGLELAMACHSRVVTDSDKTGWGCRKFSWVCYPLRRYTTSSCPDRAGAARI